MDAATDAAATESPYVAALRSLAKCKELNFEKVVEHMAPVKEDEELLGCEHAPGTQLFITSQLSDTDGKNYVLIALVSIYAKMVNDARSAKDSGDDSGDDNSAQYAWIAGNVVKKIASKIREGKKVDIEGINLWMEHLITMKVDNNHFIDTRRDQVVSILNDSNEEGTDQEDGDGASGEDDDEGEWDSDESDTDVEADTIGEPGQRETHSRSNLSDESMAKLRKMKLMGVFASLVEANKRAGLLVVAIPEMGIPTMSDYAKELIAFPCLVSIVASENNLLLVKTLDDRTEEVMRRQDAVIIDPNSFDIKEFIRFQSPPIVVIQKAVIANANASHKSDFGGLASKIRNIDEYMKRIHIHNVEDIPELFRKTVQRMLRGVQPPLKIPRITEAPSA